MTQTNNEVSTTPPLPGAALVAQINTLAETLGTDFAGATDPASLSWPYSMWADTGNNLIKRRNAAGSAWVTVGALLQKAHPEYASGSIPTSDQGPIYVVGVGDMEWNASLGAYALVAHTENQTYTVGVGSNAIAITYSTSGSRIFRKATITDGGTQKVSGMAQVAQTLTIPQGATLGTIAGVPAKFAVIEINSNGTIIPGIKNLAGSGRLDETDLISPTTISNTATSADTIYSESAVVAGSPYKVLFTFTMPGQTVAGTWTAAPTAITPALDTTADAAFGKKGLINNTGATSDICLAVEEGCYIDVAGATTVPAHIATADGQTYEILLNFVVTTTASTPSYLLSNNASYPNQFYFTLMYGDGATPGSSSGYTGGFEICNGAPSVAKITVFNKTSGAKQSISNYLSNASGSNYSGQSESRMCVASTGNSPDTTTAITSLGTFIFPVAVTGRIIICRIA